MKQSSVPHILLQNITKTLYYKKMTNKVPFHASLFFSLFSAILVMLFSTCSPLYPINPWEDANVFMTIGKNMLHGMMPYRDLFDLKGLLLFILHEWAAFFSPHSFLAIYVLQILCWFGFMTYSYKTMRLFCDTGIVFPFTCLIALLTIASDFYYYGDSVEEFCLPILSHSMYHFLLFVRGRKAPSWETGIIIGIGIGIILWMKYSILTFYFGALLAVLYLAWRRAELPVVGRTVMWVVFGILIVTVPVLGYALYHGILADFMDVYFYSNIFRYHGLETRGQMSWQEKTFPIIGYVIMLGLIWCSKARKDVRLFVFLSFAGTASILAFFKIPVRNIYYYLVLAVFLPLLIYYVRRWRVSGKNLAVFAAVGVAATLLNYNLMSLVQRSFSPKIMDIAEIINKSSCGERDVLLYRTGERGIFLLAECGPAVKHFFSVGVAYIPGEEEMQDAYLASRKARFVITTDVLPEAAGYRLVYENRDDQKCVLIVHPLLYLWRLGYPHSLLQHFMEEPESVHTCLRLYERA